jgi:hypothetical protein
MSGHIKLDGRDYLLVDPEQRVRTLANPFAAKIGGGAGDYDDLENWSAWVMDNWKAGIGQKDPTAGGTLYSEVDTRFGNQIILPPKLTFSTNNIDDLDHQNEFGISDSERTVGATGGTYQRVAFDFSTQTGPDTWKAYLTLRIDSPITGVTARLWSDSAGSPGTELDSASNTLSEQFGFNTYEFSFSYSAAATTRYWVSFEPTTAGETFTIRYKSGTGLNYSWNGSSWLFHDKIEAFASNDTPSHGANKLLVNYDSTIYALTALSLHDYNSGSDSWSGTNALTAISHAVAFGDDMYIAQGATDARRFTAPSTYTTLTGIQADLFAVWRGLLWRAYENDVWYSSDGSTWTGPIQVAADGYNVRGLAGMGDINMWYSTDEGIGFIGAGDFVFQIAPWSQVDATNGAGMLNYQGDLYIPVGTKLLRMSEGGQLLNISPNTKEGLPPNKQGTITALGRTNHYLLCATGANDDDGFSIVWAYNGEGWHFLTKLPQGRQIVSLLNDRTSNKIFILDNEGIAWSIAMPKLHANPWRDSSGTASYTPSGHFETDWFTGGLKEIDKDFESVYIAGEGITSTQTVAVYWQDDASTDWELLGTATSNRQELRWSDYTTRPSSKQIKLALVLSTTDNDLTPNVSAVRVKFHANIDDRYRWQLPIMVSDRQQMLDGTRNPYNQAQQETHLETLEQQVPPFIFEDLNGKQYEVKIVQSTQQLRKVEYQRSQRCMTYDAIYSLVIEQVNSDEYTG